jgi:hypothetical protein
MWLARINASRALSAWLSASLSPSRADQGLVDVVPRPGVRSHQFYWTASDRQTSGGLSKKYSHEVSGMSLG